MIEVFWGVRASGTSFSNDLMAVDTFWGSPGSCRGFPAPTGRSWFGSPLLCLRGPRGDPKTKLGHLCPLWLQAQGWGLCVALSVCTPGCRVAAGCGQRTGVPGRRARRDPEGLSDSHHVPRRGKLPLGRKTVKSQEKSLVFARGVTAPPDRGLQSPRRRGVASMTESTLLN